MFKYVGYDRYFDVNGVVDFFNSYVFSSIHIPVKEKKDFKIAIVNDISHAFEYRKKVWFKETDLITFFKEKFPNLDIETGFMTFMFRESMNRYFDNEEMKRHFCNLIKRKAVITENIFLEDREEEFYDELVHINGLLTIYEEYIPLDYRYFYRGHIVYPDSSSYYEEKAKYKVELLKYYIEYSKKNKRYDNESIDILKENNFKKKN